MCGKSRTIDEMMSDARKLGTMEFAKDLMEMFMCGRPIEEIRKACADTLHCGIEYFSERYEYGDIS